MAHPPTAAWHFPQHLPLLPGTFSCEKSVPRGSGEEGPSRKWTWDGVGFIIF